MNQYIITEDDFLEIFDDPDDFAVIQKRIRSRPYNPQAERDVKELFRKEIAKWKDEDPLFMAYVYGQEAEREKVLDKAIKRLKTSYDGTDDEGEANAYGVCLSTLEELRQEGKDGV